MENELVLTKDRIYDPCHWKLSSFEKEKESSDYAACRFKINDLNVAGRTAKVTPTKIGQFVTLWKRIANGPIQPFDNSDNIDLVVVNVKAENHLGQFIFPKAVLIERGIISQESKEGKRAFRVYPPWDITTSKQARKTQAWQSEFFLSLNSERPVDLKKARKLYLQG